MPGSEKTTAEEFLNIRDQKNMDQQGYFNMFFDRLLPCVAGKKMWANKDKMASTISDGGKISVTDEAFTELCLLNYWDRWTGNKCAQWTNARGGNTHCKGWSNEAYLKFDVICRRIKEQRESRQSKAMELAFLEFATEQYSRGTKRTRSGLEEEGPELFNELID